MPQMHAARKFASLKDRFSYIPRLFAEHEIEFQSAHFDNIAIIKTHSALNRLAVDARRFGARTQVIPITPLIDLRSELGLEPALQLDGGHFGFADKRELVRQQIFLL